MLSIYISGRDTDIKESIDGCKYNVVGMGSGY